MPLLRNIFYVNIKLSKASFGASFPRIQATFCFFHFFNLINQSKWICIPIQMIYVISGTNTFK